MTNNPRQNSNPIERVRSWLRESLPRLPLWKELNAISLPIALPIQSFAKKALEKMPWLEKAEWVLETRSLATRYPIAVALPAMICAWRGIMTTNLGHIGTDMAIYPVVAATSSFNPFLGLCCALIFGAADVVQKLFVNDIYGAQSRFSLDYWGALLGYILAYSSVAVMGLIPGILSRILRRVVVSAIRRAATATADGASVAQPAPSLAEDLAGMCGAFAGAFCSMHYAAPVLEMPAFYMRPHPDFSCFSTEQSVLAGNAVPTGLAGALGVIASPDQLQSGPPSPPLQGAPPSPPFTSERPVGPVTLIQTYGTDDSASPHPVGPITLTNAYGVDDSQKSYGADGFPSDRDPDWASANLGFKVGNAEATALDYVLDNPRALFADDVTEALKEPQGFLGVAATGLDFLAEMSDLAAKGDLTTQRILDVTSSEEYKIVFGAAFPEVAAIDAVTGGSIGDQVGKFGAGSVDALYALGKTGWDAAVQGNIDGGVLQDWITKANAGQFGLLGTVTLDPTGFLNALRAGDISRYLGR